MYEYVYGIVPSEGSRFKIGRWSGSISGLNSRYKTYYGDFEMIVFETTKGVSPSVETQLHKACEQYRICGELFSLDAIPRFLQSASDACLNSCRSLDYQERARRLERKRYAALAKENNSLKKMIARMQKTHEQQVEETRKIHATDKGLLRKRLNDEFQERVQSMRDDLDQLRKRLNDAVHFEVPQEVQNNIEEQKDQHNPMEGWLQENIIEAPGSRVHVHRFDRAYERWLTMWRAETRGRSHIGDLPKGGFINRLESLGHVVSAYKKNARDPECCPSIARYVHDINVREWDAKERCL